MEQTDIHDLSATSVVLTRRPASRLVLANPSSRLAFRPAPIARSLDAP